jgi:Polyketide cyclase / dehydrase and lipid transport
MKPIYDATLEMDVTRPVGEVFDHVARGLFENHGRWDPAIVGMSKTSDGPIGQGTTGIESRRYGAWSSSAPFVVDAFEEGRRFGFRSTDGPLLERVRFEFSALPEGTRIRSAMTFTPNAGAISVLGPLLRLLIARNVRMNTERMRQSIERDGSAGRP